MIVIRAGRLIVTGQLAPDDWRSKASFSDGRYAQGVHEIVAAWLLWDVAPPCDCRVWSWAGQ